MMNYLYAPEFVPERQAIYLEIEGAIGPDSRVEMFATIAGLSERLGRFNNPEIIVLLAVGRKDIPSIAALRRHSHNAPVILLLSDEDEETMASAIPLRAKFVGSMKDDLDKIVPIIEKIIQNKLEQKATGTRFRKF